MSEKKPIPTQARIARVVGLSRVTVSHILSGKNIQRYNDETRAKVLKAADELGYRPNRAAQMMRRGRSNLIGGIHFGGASVTATELAFYLPQAISSYGYEPLAVDLSWQGNNHSRALGYLLDARVEGVIICGLTESFGVNEVSLLKQHNIPTVMIANGAGFGVPTVESDTSGAFEGLVEHLVEQGHRRLRLLVNDYNAPSTTSRIQGFLQGVKKFSDGAGVTGEVVVVPADKDRRLPGYPAYVYMKKAIENGDLPDAMLCTNDHWASNIFTAALEAGMQIPQDMALTGFDNEPYTSVEPFCLTTASANISKKCAKAMEILMQIVEGRTPEETHYRFPCELIFRRSSARCVVEPLI